MVTAGCQQRLDDAHVFGRFVVAAEHIVLASERNGADLVFGKVVVKHETSIVKDTHHVVPP